MAVAISPEAVLTTVTANHNTALRFLDHCIGEQLSFDQYVQSAQACDMLSYAQWYYDKRIKELAEEQMYWDALAVETCGSEPL